MYRKTTHKVLRNSSQLMVLPQSCNHLIHSHLPFIIFFNFSTSFRRHYDLFISIESRQGRKQEKELNDDDRIKLWTCCIPQIKMQLIQDATWFWFMTKCKGPSSHDLYTRTPLNQKRYVSCQAQSIVELFNLLRFILVLRKPPQGERFTQFRA